MKTRETKQQDLNALTESLQNSKSAMVVTFSGLTVAKDQEFRNSLREAGAKYEVVKNTLARIAVKGTQFEGATEHFKGVTAIAWTEDDPVILSKAVSKFMKDNAAIYQFKTGVVDGKLIDLAQLNTIATLPSKEELISKLLFVINAQAQRLVTVINAVPRNLAVVIKQIGDAKEGEAPAAEAKAEEPAAAVEETSAPAEANAEAAPTETQEASAEPAAEDAPAAETEAATEIAADAPADAAAEVAAEAPAAETEAASETVAEAPDDAAEQAASDAPDAGEEAV